MAKPQIPSEKEAKRQHKDATINFDYTTIVDRLLKTVSWSNDCHPTGIQLQYMVSRNIFFRMMIVSSFF